MADRTPIKEDLGLDFGDWLKNRANKFYAFVGLSSLISLFGVAMNISDQMLRDESSGLVAMLAGISENVPDWLPVMHVGQLLVIVTLFVTLAMSEPQRLHDISHPVSKIVYSFKVSWLIFWFFFVLLYSMYVIQHICAVQIDPDMANSPWFTFGLNVIMHGQTFVMIYMYLLISERRLLYQENVPVVQVVFWACIIILLMGTEIAYVLLQDTEAYNPKASVVITGFVSCVAFALFFGTLQNKYIHPPISAMLFLYAYAALQVFYPSTGDAIGPLLFGAALVLKIFLFLFVTWMLHSGRLLFFVAHVYDKGDDVTEDRDTFFANKTYFP